jgi:hypothetical protein
MSEARIIVEAVVEECLVPVDAADVHGVVEPIMQNFAVPRDELIKQTARAFENQYEGNLLENGGVVIEYDGERTAIDEHGDPV